MTGGLATNVVGVCRFCDLSIAEMVAFLSADRLHMQQGLFPDVQQMFLLHSTLSFDEVTMRALIGAPLKANEFLKLEQTSLADVIVEESGNEHLRMSDQTAASPTAAAPPTSQPALPPQDIPPELAPQPPLVR